jgi:hypothetical protein
MTNDSHDPEQEHKQEQQTPVSVPTPSTKDLESKVDDLENDILTDEELEVQDLLEEKALAEGNVPIWLVGIFGFWALVLSVLGFEYYNYMIASHEMKGIADRAALKGGTNCLQTLANRLEKNLQKPNTFTDEEMAAAAYQQGEKSAKEEFESGQRRLSNAIESSSFAISAQGLTIPLSNPPIDEACIVEVKYTASVFSKVVNLFGLPSFGFSGATRASAQLAGIGTSTPSVKITD